MDLLTSEAGGVRYLHGGRPILTCLADGGVPISDPIVELGRLVRRRIAGVSDKAQGMFSHSATICKPGATSQQGPVDAGAAVATGAVVTKDVAENTSVAGVPSKLLKSIDS